MVKEKSQKLAKLLLFFYLTVFAFGQLFKLSIMGINVYLVDLIAGLAALHITLFHFGLLKKHINYFYFFVFAIFSFGISAFIFKTSSLLIGALYLLRLIVYAIFPVYVLNNLVSDKKLRHFIFNSLVVLGTAISIFGWIQYFVYPDLRFLKYFGWDDHYFRLVSTFLDPTFTGFLIVCTISILLLKLINKPRRFLYGLLFFLILTLAFTYSRSSYLALVAVSVATYFITRKIKTLFLTVIPLIFFVIFLPRPSSEGVKLERTYSIDQKVTNYKQSLYIASYSPLLGIGFNNLCLARNKFIQRENFASHSCHGSDNSFIFISVTTGVVGLILFLDLVIKLFRQSSKNIYGQALITSSLALGIHGLFTNTFFYPWVMGWFSLLIALSRKTKDYS